MSIDWTEILGRLAAYPPRVQRLQPPCLPERILALEAELGNMPTPLVQMLGHFNGAELFFKGMPFITLFGVSMVPPLPPLKWAPDWYVDKFTPAWRNAGKGRQRDWVIGIKNYGALAVMGSDASVSEWDTSAKRWSIQRFSFEDWFDDVLREGETVLRELGGT